MNDHYYTAQPSSAHQLRTITVSEFGVEAEFTTDAGVFSRDGLDTGTRALLIAIGEAQGRVLDLGCGWGAVGVLLAKRCPGIDLTMTDVNERAVALSRENLARNGIRGRVVQGDGFENVEGKFDLIATNPPIRAGKAVIYRMFADAKEHLSPEGKLFVVIRKQQGAPSALKYLKEVYDEAEVVRRDAGFWVIKSNW